jgi:hypothetical protein
MYALVIKHGIKFISNFSGETFNDSSTILGYKKDEQIKDHSQDNTTFSIPAIWRDGDIITIAELLGVENLNQISPPFSDNYTVEMVNQCLDINNTGQILCWVTIWGYR